MKMFGMPPGSRLVVDLDESVNMWRIYIQHAAGRTTALGYEDPDGLVLFNSYRSYTEARVALERAVASGKSLGQL